MEKLMKNELQRNGFDPYELFKQGFSLKSIDLIQGGTFREVIGRTIIFIMMIHEDTEKKRLFSGATVILTPMEVSEVDEDDVYEAISTAIEAQTGIYPDDNELVLLKNYVRVMHCATLEVAELEGLILQESHGRFVAIVNGSKYRDKSVSLPAQIGISDVRAAEDLWVPHIAKICERCVVAVRQTESYAFIHVEEAAPQKPELIDMLIAVDDCYPAFIQLNNDPNVIINNRSQHWIHLALDGKMDDVVNEIQSLGLTESLKLFLQLQILSRVQGHPDTLSIIQRLHPHLGELAKSNLIHIARIAYKCGDEKIAREILPKDLTGLGEEEWLVRGLAIALELQDNEIIERYDAQLASLFPNSIQLRENRDIRLLLNCELGTIGGKHIFTTAGFSVKHLEVLNALMVPNTDYEIIIKKSEFWEKEWRELALTCCAAHAQSVGNYFDAIKMGIIITPLSLYGHKAIQIVLSATHALMLKGKVPQENQDYYRYPLRAAVRFLAQYPKANDIRASLSRLLSVEACGKFGLPAIIVTMLDLARPEVLLAQSTIEPKDELVIDDDSVIEAVLNSCIEFVTEKGHGEIGVTVIPRNLVDPYSDQVIQKISQMILYGGGIEGEDVDLVVMNTLVLIVSAIRLYATTEKNEDLRLMRLLAGHYANSGDFQHARNMAEQILSVGQDTEIRCRLAWLAYADVYKRCSNPTEALIGLACAFASESTIEKRDLFEEIDTVIRVLRDLGMSDLASEFLPTLKTISDDLGYDSGTSLRIICIELSIRLVNISSLDSKSITILINDIIKACRLIKDKSDVLPLIGMLSQSIMAAEERSIEVSKEALFQLEVLVKRISARESDNVETISSLVPTAHLIVKMFNNIEQAMYGVDAASDLKSVAIAARRLLTYSMKSNDTCKANTLAIELLADQSMTTFGDLPKLTEDWVLQYAVSLNSEGLDVVFMALNTDDELTITFVSKGAVTIIEQPKFEKSFQQRMDKWLEKYPKSYGFINEDDGHNEFFNTMNNLGVVFPISENLLIVSEPLLQQLTANLVYVHPDQNECEYFYGSKSAVGFVPSLRWLSMTKARARTNKSTYRAWISVDTETESTRDSEVKLNGTLSIAFERLSGAFNKYGFIVETNSGLPNGMADASLAVVTAHGGLGQDGRYLQRISDDDSLIESPSALAASLADVELVILFVCSGGRIDKDPWDNRTVGLPRLLLNKGVRAVIASPWPLDVKVTYNWLEPFMDAWGDGMTVLQATKIANQAVVKRLGDNPKYSLAMSAYGDLLMTKQSTQ